MVWGLYYKTLLICKTWTQKNSAKKSKIGDDNLSLYEKDYQLARAIDLLRGISVYKTIKK